MNQWKQWKKSIEFKEILRANKQREETDIVETIGKIRENNNEFLSQMIQEKYFTDDKTESKDIRNIEKQEYLEILRFELSICINEEESGVTFSLLLRMSLGKTLAFYGIIFDDLNV